MWTLGIAENSVKQAEQKKTLFFFNTAFGGEKISGKSQMPTADGATQHEPCIPCSQTRHAIIQAIFLLRLKI